MTPLAAFNVRSDGTGRENSSRLPTSDVGILPLNGSSHEVKTATDDQVDDLETEVGVNFLQKKEDMANDKREVMHGRINLQVDDISRTRENKISNFSDQLKLDVPQNDTRSEEPIVALSTEAYHTKINNATSLGKGHEELPSFLINESKNTMDAGLPGNCTLEKLESTDENDLQTPHSENAWGLASKIENPESTNDFKSNSLHDDAPLPGNTSLAVKPSLTTSLIRTYHMKGKAKALSDGNANGRTSNEEDASHESAESCNSAGLFSTGKQQWSLEPQPIVGSNIVKKHSQGSPCSSSFMKHDSSFLNWISNMTKGFLKPDDVEAPSLAITIANPSNGYENHHQNLLTCNKNQDPSCRNMGFQSIFQSLYCPTRKKLQTAALNADYQEEPKKQELHNEICNTNATPIACRKVTGHVYKQFLLSNEKCNESTYDSKAETMVQPEDVELDSAAHQEINRGSSAGEINRSSSAGNKSTYDLETNKENVRTSFISALGKRKSSRTEKIGSELASEGKMAHNFGDESGPLTSLWITLFTPKTCCPMSNEDICNKSVAEALDCPTDVMRLKPQLQDHQGSVDGEKIVERRDNATEDPVFVHNCATGSDSFGLCKVRGGPDEKSMSKLSPILPSQRTKTSGAMASVFAKRLDALKHVRPSDVADTTACTTLTCFFCGVKGHCLQDCSEVTYTELEDLMRNINSYEAAELSCICIRCLQPDHWAVGCPNASSSVRYQAERGSSLVGQCGPRKMELNARNEENQKLPDDRASQLQAACAPDPRMEKGLDLNLKSHEATSHGKIKLDVAFFGNSIVSSSGEKTTKKSLMTHFCNFANSNTSDVPKGIFDAVKGLRLSRADILKWINSQMPLSHLDGFFLRLRLGKWEEGLEGAGYYVACINGVQRESLTRESKRSIAVNVSGIKCFVESPFVSNHDFLEDELMAWWFAILRSGGKIPSEEDLKLKAKEKKMLGF